MYVSVSQLTETFRAMPIAELAARVESASLLPEAHAIAEAELKARLARGESLPPNPAGSAHAEPPPGVKSGGWPRRVVVGVYLAFLAVCLAGTLLDPPANLESPDGYAGMIGLIATQAAGFPLNLVVVVVLAPLVARHVAGLNGAYAFVILSWLCACVNVAVLWRLLLRRKA